MNPKPKRIEDDNVLQLFRNQPCIICGQRSDPCHIKSKGSGGDDVPWNLMALCRGHHIKSHQLGWFVFATREQRVWDELKTKGWAFEAASLHTGAPMKLRHDSGITD